MKNIVLIMTLIVSCLFAGCDSLANKSEDKLSGDDFWAQGNETNAEAFLLSIYNSFRNATMSQRPFLTYSGDMRCAPITAYSTGDKYVAYLANNDMGELRNTYPDDARGGLIMQWDVFYTAIQDANILLAEIDKVPGMDELKRSRFKAEAIFMRNLSYFFIVRAFGDVPYYTNAYNEAPLPRTNMVIVLQNCLADLQPLLDDDPGAEVLPWSYSSYSSKGIRASRGSVIALMMHINLWLVQFDAQNKEQYYRNVVSLGEELERNNGAYSLLDINRSSVIFAGGSDEGLFEIAQNINFNEIFMMNAKFSDNVSLFLSEQVYTSVLLFRRLSNESVPYV
ncbi:RagB/SusD family nutrient uptake outer membrane protein [Bacteroides thetaiotaomicron]|nr:RagB/SusD family nutrient uptake outer membrane protein [Bacteroides thetaiotaomicron]MCS2841241.1 RagB/SusD family nutrient uptake outer membrane protein [Bacteroides thetaiotaomicron]